MSVSLLQACDDHDLLGVELWPRQREVLERIDSGRYREIVLCLGRRSGKSLMAAICAVHDACFRDLTQHLREGERRYVVCVAVNREQAKLVLQFCRDLLTQSPLLRECVENDTEDAIEVRQPRTGALVVIRTLPCSSRAGRGLAISTLIADELAHWQSEVEGPAAADRVYGSLTPALAQFKQHGRVIAISTPWGRSNLFYRLYQRATSGEHDDMLAEHAPTWTVNPTLDGEFFERERAKDPELYRGEYGAEFLASGGAFLEYERIEAAVNEDRHELPAELLGPTIAALDVAWAKDPFALAVIGRDPIERRQLRLAAVRSWLPKGTELEVATVLDEVAEICLGYGVTGVLVDQYCSAPVRQGLRDRGLSAREVTMTASSKTAIYTALKQKLFAGELELYRHEPLLAELSRIEAHYAANSASVRIPRVGSSHGDLAQAVALATWDLARSTGGDPTQRARTGGYRRDALGDPIRSGHPMYKRYDTRDR